MHLTSWLGAALLILGIWAFLSSSGQSWTALIPAIFGLAFLGAAEVARRPRRKRAAIIAATVLALIGVGGTFGGLLRAPALLTGAELERPMAVAVQSVMAILCISYVLARVTRPILSVVPARRSRYLERR